MLIVEDEKPAADALLALVRRYEESRGVTFDVDVVDAAFELLDASRTYDICLLDIQLPGINGMEAAELLRSQHRVTSIIFVTDLAQYAVRGYEVDALDFIVKPVTYFNFRMRMDKAMRRIRRNGSRSIAIGTRDGMRVVALSDIEYVEVSKHDLSYHLVGEEEPFVVYGSLVAFEQEVEGGPFVRISNSCLVNMNRIRVIRGGELVMHGGKVLYFSRSRKREAVATITGFLGGSI